MVTPRKKAEISAAGKKRSKTRGVSDRHRQSRQEKYQKEKRNHARVAKHRENCRQNGTIKRERANIASETMATQAREIERLQATITILEQQDLPGDDNDEVLDEMDEASEEIKRHVKANPKWWEQARACEPMKHRMAQSDAKDYSMACKNTTWHGTKAMGARTATTLSARSALFVCLHFFRQYLVGANMALIYGCHQRTLA